mgnify:CR=1 FL=1
MFNRLAIAALLTIAASGQAFATDHGSWHNDSAQGYERYWTANTSGARFTIWCPKNRNVRGALIGIELKGRLPSADSLVRVQLDHDLVKFTAGPDGYIRNDCPACADNLTYFWHRLRAAAKFVVQFEDKRYAGFSLNGVKEAVPHGVCLSQIATKSQ